MRKISFALSTLFLQLVYIKAFSLNNHKCLGRLHEISRRQKYDADQNTSFNLENKQRSTSHATALALSSMDTLVPLPQVALASLFPSLIGYYKTEYGVSYAYGTAVSSIAWLVLRQLRATSSSLGSIAGVHSLALLAYGIRLNLFLLYRELMIPRFRKFREKIEDRSKSRGNRLSRTPFILSVALLYACLGMPLITTAGTLQQMPFWSIDGGVKVNAVRFLVGTTCLGFLVAAIGDITKSLVKARRGEDHLVTEGLFQILRHPNYTGEFFAWAASAITANLLGGLKFKIASIIGALGINFVLVQAATGLEKKQREKYGDEESYQNWIKGSWAGVTMKKKEEEMKTEEKKEEEK